MPYNIHTDTYELEINMPRPSIPEHQYEFPVTIRDAYDLAWIERQGGDLLSHSIGTVVRMTRGTYEIYATDRDRYNREQRTSPGGMPVPFPYLDSVVHSRTAIAAMNAQNAQSQQNANWQNISRAIYGDGSYWDQLTRVAENTVTAPLHRSVHKATITPLPLP